MGDSGESAHFKKMYDRVSTLAKIGVWECDLTTEELIWTDMVYDIFGIPRGNPINREDTLRLYEPNSRQELERLRSEAIERGTGFTLDVRIRPHASEVRWVRLTAEVELEEGKPVRIFGTKQDITNEKAASDKLQSIQTEMIHLSRGSAMGAMASTIAHELNQPLATISSYLTGARRRIPNEHLTPDLSECFDGALNATLRAAQIIRSVRAVLGKSGSKKREADLEEVLRQAADLALAGSENVLISWDVPPGLAVYADSIQIQQVLINLIRNASEAVQSGPCQIDIKAWPKHTFIEVCVSDNGPGLPIDIIADAFEGFASGKSDGLGVGLSISRTIIEAHGGRIRAENVPGRGASVSFTLPQPADTQS
ncbi:hypothetical protein GCM10011515_01450 [Tsuneonella deserti]|uniref:histidine kinase n=1 Tax=Tsuneonella deserti TaxID=2035528 RepID=A0ABQ1RWR3_9SPHN|nr:ATP-binding protein [Tsuneonella deserti]GGD85498.1 hypothetical protein GCM10011515_01450 [Tsuneonella deserti]